MRGLVLLLTACTASPHSYSYSYSTPDSHSYMWRGFGPNMVMPTWRYLNLPLGSPPNPGWLRDWQKVTGSWALGWELGAGSWELGAIWSLTPHQRDGNPKHNLDDPRPPLGKDEKLYTNDEFELNDNALILFTICIHLRSRCYTSRVASLTNLSLLLQAFIAKWVGPAR